MKGKVNRPKPRRCCVQNCTNSNFSHSLFTFPTFNAHTKERFVQWLKSTGNPALLKVHPDYFSNHYFICSIHFSEAQFAGSSKRKLRKNSFPDLFCNDFNVISEPSVNLYLKQFCEETVDSCDVLGIACEEEMLKSHPISIIHSSQINDSDSKCDQSSVTSRRKVVSELGDSMVQTNDPYCDHDQPSGLVIFGTDISSGTSHSNDVPENLDRPKPRRCCVQNCTNSNFSHSLFTFPTFNAHTKERFVQWLKSTGNPALLKVHPDYFSNHYFICSIHFSEAQFAGSSKRKLRKNSFPDLFCNDFNVISEPSVNLYLKQFCEETVDSCDVLGIACEEEMLKSHPISIIHSSQINDSDSKCDQSSVTSRRKVVSELGDSMVQTNDPYCDHDQPSGLVIFGTDISSGTSHSNDVPENLDRPKPRRCCVQNCTNSNFSHSLFTFPTFNAHTKERFVQWLKSTGNPALLKVHPDYFSNHYFICSIHFSEAQFAGSSKRKLRKNSFPDLFCNDFNVISEPSVNLYLKQFCEETVDSCDVLGIGCEEEMLKSHPISIIHSSQINDSDSKCDQSSVTSSRKVVSELGGSMVQTNDPYCDHDQPSGLVIFGTDISSGTSHSNDVPENLDNSISQLSVSEVQLDKSKSGNSAAIMDQFLSSLPVIEKRKVLDASAVPSSNPTEPSFNFQDSILTNEVIEQSSSGTAQNSVSMFVKRKCCALGCKSTNLTSTLHSFPGVYTTERGVTKMDRSKLESEHFVTSDFSSKHNKYLKRNVFPSVLACAPLSAETLNFYCLEFGINLFGSVGPGSDKSIQEPTEHSNPIQSIPLEEGNILIEQNNVHHNTLDTASVENNNIHENCPGSDEDERLDCVPYEVNQDFESTDHFQSKRRVKRCSAVNCNNTSDLFSMHRFPSVLKAFLNSKKIDKRNQQRLLKWLEVSGNCELLEVHPIKLSSHYYMCEEHFDSFSYERNKNRLKCSAIPTFSKCKQIPSQRLASYEQKLILWNDNVEDVSIFSVLSDEDCALKFEDYMSSLGWNECKGCKEKHIGPKTRNPKKCVHGGHCWEYSEVNNMDPMDCPDELKNLSFIEEQLIARIHPLISVFKLKGLQYGYKGNVINFRQNVDKFASELPHKISDLNSIVIVKFKNKSVKSHDFRVRSQKILDALQWLKLNNPFYKDVTISPENLQLLPNDDIIYEDFDFIDEIEEENCQSGTAEDSGMNINETLSCHTSDDEMVDLETDVVTSTVPITSPVHPDSQIKSVLDWPEMEDDAINEFQTVGYIACAFPTLFPTGQADLRSSRYKTINVSNYFRHLLNYCDNRFAKHKTFRYFALNSWMRWSALNDGNVFVRNNQEFRDMTPDKLKELLKEKPSLIKKVMFQASNIRGTKQFWHAKCNELRDMVEQIGLPTFFLTLSAADGHWHDLYRLLSDSDPSSLTERERRKLLQENPYIVDTFFSLRVEAFIKHVLEAKYKIKDYWYRIEYQHRGSPHIHGVFWIEGAPDVEKFETLPNEQKADIINYFSTLTTAVNPRPDCVKPDVHPCRVLYNDADDKEVDLAQMILTVQRHTRCSKEYCLRVHKKTKELKCRFKFPFEMQCEGCIKKSDSGILEFLPERNDPLINRFNPHFLQVWRANMDICPVISKEALIAYLAKYIAKSESTSEGFFELVDSFVSITDKSSSTKQAIQKLFIRSCAERDYSSQEVCHILSGKKLYSTGGRKFIVVNTSLNNKWRMVTSEGGGETSEHFGKSFLEKYKARPAELEHVSLWDLASKYNFAASKWTKAKKTNIVRVFPRYHKTATKDDELYYQQQVLLHQPWRDYNYFCSLNETWENIFKRFNLRDNNSIDLNAKSEAVEKLEEFEESNEISETNVSEMEEWMLASQLAPNQDIPTIELGRRDCDINYDWTSGYEKYKQYGSINEFQSFISDKKKMDSSDDALHDIPDVVFSPEQSQVRNYMEKQILFIKSGELQLVDAPLKRIIVQGKAGTGKSLLIKFLTSTLNSEFGDGCYLLVAPTGVSALNINGQTIHSVFHIPINYKEYKPLTGEQARKFCNKLESVKFLIIDEYSMIGLKLLGFINERCRQAKSCDDFFGGMYVYIFGDIKQLPPVKDTPVYNNPSKSTLASFGKAAFDSFQTAFYLTKSHRQSDSNFQTVLDNMSTGDFKLEDYELLSSRFSSNLPRNEIHAFDDAIRLFPTVALVESYNMEKIRNLVDPTSHEPCPIARVPAKHNCMSAQNASPDDADGLAPVIYLAKNCRIMLRKNLWVSKGLVNGAMGTVIDLIYDENSDPGKDPPCVIMCEFDSYTGPTLSPGTMTIPIAPFLKSWTSNKDEKLSRLQYPIVLCYACSIHKSQGLTLQKAVIDLGKTEFQVGISYVALSRVKELKGLLLEPFNLDRISKLRTSLSMISRLEFLGKLSLLSQQCS